MLVGFLWWTAKDSIHIETWNETVATRTLLYMLGSVES